MFLFAVLSLFKRNFVGKVWCSLCRRAAFIRAGKMKLSDSEARPNTAETPPKRLRLSDDRNDVESANSYNNNDASPKPRTSSSGAISLSDALSETPKKRRIFPHNADRLVSPHKLRLPGEKDQKKKKKI
jgi:hypothetical protein